MSLQRYQFLREEERNLRRTVSHAIDVLADGADFGGADVADIRVGALCLPSRENVGLLSVSFESKTLGKTFVVSLATSAMFTARCQGEEAARQFSIFELDGAKADNDNSVRLSDGTILTALMPARWEWQVCESDALIMSGYATSRETAQVEGDSALFLLLRSKI